MFCFCKQKTVRVFVCHSSKCTRLNADAASVAVFFMEMKFVELVFLSLWRWTKRKISIVDDFMVLPTSKVSMRKECEFRNSMANKWAPFLVETLSADHIACCDDSFGFRSIFLFTQLSMYFTISISLLFFNYIWTVFICLWFVHCCYFFFFFYRSISGWSNAMRI